MVAMVTMDAAIMAAMGTAMAVMATATMVIGPTNTKTGLSK
jgi:hypothetical protein